MDIKEGTRVRIIDGDETGTVQYVTQGCIAAVRLDGTPVLLAVHLTGLCPVEGAGPP